jgi:hypothetical protein
MIRNLRYPFILVFSALLLITHHGHSQLAALAVHDHEVPFNATVVLSISDYQGEYMQWQHSEDMAIWMNIPGATADTLLFVASESIYLRARVIAGDCDPFYSDITRIIVIRLSSVSTHTVSDIDQTSALSGGTVIDDGGSTVTVRGVVWSTGQDPTLEENDGFTEDGTGTGVFTSGLTGLLPNTTYYVRAYATNSVGTAYGDQEQFTTLEEEEEIVVPTVTTVAVTDITQASASGGGEVTDDGGDAIAARGVVWSTGQDPTLEENDGFTEDGTGTGVFTSELTGLLPNTIYYARAYATNSVGTAYGGQEQFTTLEEEEEIVVPTVTTVAVTDITQASASGGGEVTDDGGRCYYRPRSCMEYRAGSDT